MSQLGLGYRIQDENHAKLAMGAKPLGFRASKLQTWDPTSTLKLVSQFNMGSCTGHAMAVLAQYLNYLKSGQVVQMSRMWCYLQAQKHSGFIGSDQGASIAGAVEAAMQDGVCREETFPYPNPVRYDTHEPAGAAPEAKLHPVHSKSQMRSYDDCRQYTGSGVGGLDLGINWTEGLANFRGLKLERQHLGGQTLGGHSVAGVCLSTELDASGRNYIWFANSHGPQWGHGGWAMVAPDVWEYWIQSGAAVYGVSDMTSYGERDIPVSELM